MDRTELPLEPRHIGVPSSVSKMISMPMLRSVQTVHLSCVALYPNGTNRAPPVPRRLRSTLGMSKMIYEPMVHLTQTKHLSCTDTNTVSEQIETRFHMIHVT
jgi:uncharacterized protein YcgL (UPF0745 family)